MCSVDPVILQQYIDDELELTESLIFKEHLKSCQSCRRHLNQLKIIDWDLKHLEISIPSELAQVRQATLNQHLQKQAITSQKTRGLIALPQQILSLSTSFIKYTPQNWLMKTAKQTFTAKSNKRSNKRSSWSFVEKIIRI